MGAVLSLIRVLLIQVVAGMVSSLGLKFIF